MESSSAYGEHINTKTRKPYTITKQREKWTEEEHNSFLEALKLYGRAWQRIEEHIGTKSAVQIRSHAQKFFTKLEKEAVAKGVPISQALDIEIPPPRPKRKPNYPYPRKTDPKTHAQVAQNDDKHTTLASSLQVMDLERKPLPEKTCDKGKPENAKTSEQAQIEGFQKVPCASVSTENENSIPRSNPNAFRHNETNTSYITIEARKHQELDQDGIKHTNITSNISFFERSQPVNLTNDMKGVQLQAYPRHAPVQLVEGSQENTAKTSVPPDLSLHESKVNNSGEVYQHPNNPNLSVKKPTASATSGHHNNATFHPLFTPCSDNQENNRSFLEFSSAISSLIVSSLLQNPAAHAAATFAAKFWHSVNTEASSADSFSRDQLNPEMTAPPSMAAIAAATVAAATAWWSAHGLLPVCTPFYQGGYSCTFGTPIDGNLVNNGRDKAPSEGVVQEEKMDAEKTESAADLSSSEDSEKKLNTEVILVDTNGTALVGEPHDSIKLTNAKKQVDRSSSGSNTISSSEIETDGIEKHVKEMGENKGPDVKESNTRRGRSIITTNESWKEVSEEGRLAFQALFSREVLPQSFSDSLTKDQQNLVKNSELDLNRASEEPWESNSNGFSVLSNVKLNAHHTGFKPYKRCSVEAKENSKIMSATSTGGGQNDEKGPKRMCFETEAST